MSDEKIPHSRAVAWLVWATFLWGLSFPLAKALWFDWERRGVGSSSAFMATLSVAVRFGVAFVLLVGFRGEWLRGKHRPRELEQAGALAFFSALGLYLQMDALNYTSASISAFLTQCYCVFIPCLQALWRKRFPPLSVVGAALLVLAGVAVLSGVQGPGVKGPGRGEWETVAASLVFAFQIMILEQERYRENRSLRVSAIMFALVALLLLPVVLFSSPHPGAIRAALSSGPAWVLLAALSLLSTLWAFHLMNHYQSAISAAEAGLLYCAEPLFASVLALFLPGLLSMAFAFNYPNEVLSARLLWGGALILAANVWVQWPRLRRPLSTS